MTLLDGGDDPEPSRSDPHRPDSRRRSRQPEDQPEDQPEGSPPSEGSRQSEATAAEGAGANHEPGQEPARRVGGRAGRNLPAAFAVGGGLAAAVLAALLLWRPVFLGIIVAAVTVAVWELCRAVAAHSVRPPLPPLLVGGVAMPVAAWVWGPSGLALALLFTVLLVMVWCLRRGPDGYLRDISTGTLVAVYVPFLAGFAALLAAADDGHWRVLAMLGVVVLCDTGGYVAGIWLGHRPLAPTISPKKSWEGLGGSLTAAALGGGIGLPLIFGVDWWWGALFGLVVAAAAVVGDLVESLLKRDLKIKDMSALLPGHGGVMDRVDSILFAAPTAYLLLAVLAQ